MKMSQQILLLDISTASARSKGQALRYAQPQRTQRERKIRRNELRWEKSKATPPVLAITKSLAHRAESSQGPAEEIARPTAYDGGMLSMLGSQFEAAQEQEILSRSIELKIDPLCLPDVSSDSFDILEISDAATRAEQIFGVKDVELQQHTIDLFRISLSGSEIDNSFGDASRVALAIRLGSNRVHWQDIYQGLFPYRLIPHIERWQNSIEFHLSMLRDPNSHIEVLCDITKTSLMARLGRLFCFSVVLISRELSGSPRKEMSLEAAESREWELASLIAKYHVREELKDFLLLMGPSRISTASHYCRMALEKFGTGFKAEIEYMKSPISMTQQEVLASNKTHSTFTFREYLHDMTTNGSILS